MSGASAFTTDDVEQILRIVDRLSDVEVRIEHGDLKLHVRKFSSSAPAAVALTPLEAPAKPAAAPAPAIVDRPAAKPAPAAAPAAHSSAQATPDGAVAVRAPMLGRFFRAPSPSDPVYVEPGQRVRAEDPVCLIEIMKLFTTVNAGVNGTVISVSVENGEMVEHGQVLFLIRPE